MNIGDTVSHPKMGEGVVLDKEAVNHGYRLLVQWNDDGEVSRHTPDRLTPVQPPLKWGDFVRHANGGIGVVVATHHQQVWVTVTLANSGQILPESEQWRAENCSRITQEEAQNDH